jgi:outer membrane protein TolC
MNIPRQVTTLRSCRSRRGPLETILALLSVVLGAGGAEAGRVEKSQSINLITVLRLAGARNLDIQIASERLAEARAAHEAARMQWFPYLAPGFQFRGHDGNTQTIEGTIIDARKQSVTLGAAIILQLEAGETYYKSLIAQKLAHAAEFALEVQREETVWQAASAYLELVRARAAVGVAAEAVNVARNYAAQVGQAVDAGIAFKGDAFRATTQIERNELTRRQAREQQRIASARLSQVLQISPKVELFPDEETPAPLTFKDASLSIDELTGRALASRPEMDMSAEQLAAAVSNSEGARWAPLVPTLRAEYFHGGLGGGVGNGGTRQFNESQEYGIGLTWRIGPGGLFDSSRAHLADARQRGVAIERVKLQDEITRQVVEAHTRVHSLTDQLVHARKALEAAEEALNLAGERKAFAVGEVLENIVAEQELTRARLDYLSVVTEHNRAQFLLRRAIGAGSAAVRRKK